MSVVSEIGRFTAASEALGYPCELVYSDFSVSEAWIAKVQSNTTANIQRMLYDVRFLPQDVDTMAMCGDVLVPIACGLAVAARNPADAQTRLELWLKALGYSTPGGNLGEPGKKPYTLRDGEAEEIGIWRIQPENGEIPIQPLPMGPNLGIWIASVQMEIVWFYAS